MVNKMKTILISLISLIFLGSGVGYAQGLYTNSAHGNSTSGVDRAKPGYVIDAKYADYSPGNCAHCHEAHASIGGTEPLPDTDTAEYEHAGPDPALLFSEEEGVCEVCHDGSPATDDIKAQINKTYAHPTDTISGVHKVSESTTADMDPGDYDPTNSLHAECVDCHNPHAAGSTVHAAETNTVTATSPLYKVSGVNPPSTTAWETPTASAYTEKPTSTGISFEYELCYKCHSSWTGPNDPVVRDTAKEFNPANASYHSVEDTGKASAYGVYETPWDPSSLMYCSDCHGSQTSSDPAGPHGSTINNILKGEYSRTTGAYGSDTSSHLCFICHDYDTYRAQNLHTASNQSGFTTQKSSSYYNLHTYDKHQNAVCMDCHAALPHGINRRHLIVLSSDPAPYDNSVQLTNYIPNDNQDYKKSSCSTLTSGCH